jgi:sterol desaturase/sphingolipid hydroxylase (fatty acid hydroxylase superfamily)
MRIIKQLAWCLGGLLACGLLLLPGNGAIQRFASAHPGVAFYSLLPLLLAIPVSVASISSAFLLEWLFTGWRRSSLAALRHASASVRLDVLSFAMALLPKRWVGYALSIGLLYVVDLNLLQPRNVSLNHFLPSWGLQVACLVLFQSFISYWMHRLEHSVPALWALHQFHHSADRMSILTTDRQTSLTRGVEQIVMVFFLALLADPTAAKPGVGSSLFMFVAVYFAYRTFMGVNHYLCHSNLTTDYGWIGRWLIVSPRMHRLHHAVLPRFHGKNFTFDLVIWDRLFGTYANCDAAVVAAVPLGLDGHPFNSSGIKGLARDYFLTPYVVLWQALRTGAAAWVPERFSRYSGDIPRGMPPDAPAEK